MKTTTATAALILVALGFGGGWFASNMLHGKSGTGLNDSNSRKSVPENTAAFPGVKPAGVVVKSEPADVPASQRGSAVDRLDALAWASQHGLSVGVSVFQMGSLDPTFATVYGLSPNEVAALNVAIHAAKDKLSALAIQVAKVQPSADGTQLVVEVPAVTDQGSAIYDSLLQAFSGVLGPDRLQAFNQLSGNSFESGFDSFGLANTRYELTATDQTDSNGQTLYKIAMSSALPGSQSTSNGTVTLEQVGAFSPVLGHFAPTVFQPHHGPN